MSRINISQNEKSMANDSANISRRYFSNKQSTIVLDEGDSKTNSSQYFKNKGYQASTYSMSRKNSVKVKMVYDSYKHNESF